MFTSPDENMVDKMSADEPSTGASAAPAIVWLEAEQLFIVRGFLYRVESKPDVAYLTAELTPQGLARPYATARDNHHIDDTEIILTHEPAGWFVALSSRAAEPLRANLPAGWSRIIPLAAIEPGTRFGPTIVIRNHGDNEYTVIPPTTSRGRRLRR